MSDAAGGENFARNTLHEIRIIIDSAHLLIENKMMEQASFRQATGE